MRINLFIYLFIYREHDDKFFPLLALKLDKKKVTPSTLSVKLVNPFSLRSNQFAGDS